MVSLSLSYFNSFIISKTISNIFLYPGQQNGVHQRQSRLCDRWRPAAFLHRLSGSVAADGRPLLANGFPVRCSPHRHAH